MSMRTNFPEAGTEYMGGHSNGWEYQTTFGGSSLEANYSMLKQFLEEEGYADIPLPASSEELEKFRLPPVHVQKSLFDRCGYIHNPIKIFFDTRKRKTHHLILHIYNEQFPNHLLKFHGLE